MKLYTFSQLNAFFKKKNHIGDGIFSQPRNVTETAIDRVILFDSSQLLHKDLNKESSWNQRTPQKPKEAIY